MALTLVVEDGTGKTNSNSYASSANGDSYHDKHVAATDWTGATTAVKEAALAHATRLLDENVSWHGIKQDPDQALEWPRAGVSDKNGYAIDSNEIQQWLIDATAELARWMIIGDRTLEAGEKGFKRLKVGDLELEPNLSDRKEILPKIVIRMVAPFGTVAGGMTAKLVRV